MCTSAESDTDFTCLSTYYISDTHRLSHTQEYFEQFPQQNGSIFLFNTYTGEAIYDVDRWGSPLPDAHKLSHWFEPTAVVPPHENAHGPSVRIDVSNVRISRIARACSSK